MEKVLQKAIADSGCCSRRKAEEMVRCGRVMVNGRLAEIGQRVSDDDVIEIDGHSVTRAVPLVYLALNKPIGYVCTNRSFAGEQNIFELLDCPERLFVVGRLDKDSRGLVILTNDGDTAQHLAHPRYGHRKKYDVELRQALSVEEAKDITQRLLNGVDIGDGDGIVRAEAATYAGGRFLLELSEGKKRQIRRMLGALGLFVVDLCRTEIAGIKLGSLQPGQWRDISKEKTIQLAKSQGLGK